MAAALFPQLAYGWVVVVASSDKIDFIDSGVTYVGTLNAGNYSPGAFAGEVQRAMRAIQLGTNNSVTFDPILSKFTLTGSATFSLLFGSGANSATNCAPMLGFTQGGGAGNDKTLATTYTGAVSGVSPSVGPALWTLAEPTEYSSPATPGTESGLAAGIAASFLKRTARVRQNITDGNSIETIYFSTLKRYVIAFNSLTSSEATKFEAFWNWVEQGRPFCYQPDKTTALALRLRADLGSDFKIDPNFAWVTRSEISYGKLPFLEDTSA